jgi:hypothetical protein
MPIFENKRNKKKPRPPQAPHHAAAPTLSPAPAPLPLLVMPTATICPAPSATAPGSPLHPLHLLWRLAKPSAGCSKSWECTLALREGKEAGSLGGRVPLVGKRMGGDGRGERESREVIASPSGRVTIRSTHHRRFVTRPRGDTLWTYHCRVVLRTGSDVQYHRQFHLDTVMIVYHHPVWLAVTSVCNNRFYSSEWWAGTEYNSEGC